MLVFGHIGITLGTALVVNQIFLHVKHTQPAKQMAPITHPKDTDDKGNSPRLVGVKGIFDVSCLILGSILPDLIDKPVGHYFFTQTFGNNGRIFSHTLLFLSLFLVSGIVLFIFQKRTYLLSLSFGIFMHLVLDFMWQTPKTLFWPFWGWNFPRSPEYNFLGSIIYQLFKYPSAYIPELFGALIVCWFIRVLGRKK